MLSPSCLAGRSFRSKTSYPKHYPHSTAKNLGGPGSGAAIRCAEIRRDAIQALDPLDCFGEPNYNLAMEAQNDIRGMPLCALVPLWLNSAY